MADDRANPAIMPTPDEARAGCCGQYRKPCTYHEGYGDGWEAAEQHVETTDLDTPAPVTALACDHCGTPIEVRGVQELHYVHANTGMAICTTAFATVDGCMTPPLDSGSDPLTGGER